MDINLIGMPIYYGCDKEGVECGPSALREYKIVDLIKKFGHRVYDLGDIIVPKASVEEKYRDHANMKYLSPIVESCNNLAQQVYLSLNSNCLPFVVGGDHALGIGSIAGASKHFKELAVIWVDAHTDINSHETSPSGNIHGMPLSASMNVGHPTLTNIYYEGQKVKPENVYIIGARDIDPGEVQIAEKTQLNLYTMDTVREKGLENILNTITEKIKASNVDGVHLSFDLDSLDPSIIPGTGTPVADGFDLEEGKLILTKILNEKFVTSMDFVELNPILDNEDKVTIKNCIELLELIFRLI